MKLREKGKEARRGGRLAEYGTCRCRCAGKNGLGTSRTLRSAGALYAGVYVRDSARLREGLFAGLPVYLAFLQDL